MEITKATMEAAAPHLYEAGRHIDTLRYFVRNKDRLSLDSRVPMYFQALVKEVCELQKLFYNEQEFHELFYKTIAEMSKDRVYEIHTTKDNDGKQYFNYEGLLPLDMVQAHMLLTGGSHERTVEVPRSEFHRQEEAGEFRDVG